jgi:tetratricopeptide (TPR) repeat protein
MLIAAALPVSAQLRLPRPSPKSSVMQTIGLTDMTITYSRPGIKGRSVWGTLVPYGKVWRTGANEATTIAFTDDVEINGQKLPAGTYSLHTIPGPDQWTIIFNKVANQWGSFNYDEKQDALRVTAKPEKSPFHEWLTFEVPELSSDTAKVEIAWGDLAVPFTVKTNTKEKALANIRAALASAKPDDWRTPMNAANFAYQNDVARDERAAWLEKSLQINTNIQNLYTKAQIEAREGHKADAIRTAELAISKAGEKDKEEVEEIKKSIATWK